MRELKVGDVVRFYVLATVVIVLVFNGGTGLAADDSDKTKDAELKLLRATVKRQAEELEPLRAKIRSQAAEIAKSTAELEAARHVAQEAAAAEIAAVKRELEEVRQELADRESQLSEATAKLRASSPTAGTAESGDPVREEFVSSFRKFTAELEPAFKQAYEGRDEKAETGFSYKVSNIKADVVSTNSAMYPLVGVVTVACHWSHSVQTSQYGSHRVEQEEITMRFTRQQGRWKLIEATKRTTKVTGGDTLGKKYDSEGGGATDFTRAPAVREAVTAARGLLPE